jgi:hypothetical protein
VCTRIHPRRDFSPVLNQSRTTLLSISFWFWSSRGFSSFCCSRRFHVLSLCRLCGLIYSSWVHHFAPFSLGSQSLPCSSLVVSFCSWFFAPRFVRTPVVVSHLSFACGPSDLIFLCSAPALNLPPAAGLICSRFLFPWCSLLLCSCWNLPLRVLP